MRTATYTGEEITVEFEADFELDDYGVRGSPVFESMRMETLKVRQLYILDVDVQISALPLDLQEAIYALHSEVEFQ